MIGILIELLHEVRAEEESIRIAKGKNHLPERKELPKRIKEIFKGGS